MHPILFKLGPVTIHTYGVFIATAFLLGILYAMHEAKRENLPPARILDLGLIIIISALLGGKLLLILINLRYYLRNPADIVWTLRYGGVYYGGLLLATAAGIWYMKRASLPVGKTVDVLAPGIALGQFIGRFGCFFAGCCYGKPLTFPLFKITTNIPSYLSYWYEESAKTFWGITFTNPYTHRTIGTPLNIPLYPTELFHSFAGLMILLILILARKKRSFYGELFLLYLILYSASRFFIEYMRGDPRGAVFGGLFSTSQLIALIVGPICLTIFTYKKRAVRRKALR
jgi:phosphatidylglycerol:prolipoprotein diacylglycerol transferase